MRSSCTTAASSSSASLPPKRRSMKTSMQLRASRLKKIVTADTKHVFPRKAINDSGPSLLLKAGCSRSPNQHSAVVSFSVHKSFGEAHSLSLFCLLVLAVTNLQFRHGYSKQYRMMHCMECAVHCKVLQWSHRLVFGLCACACNALSLIAFLCGERVCILCASCSITRALDGKSFQSEESAY